MNIAMPQKGLMLPGGMIKPIPENREFKFSTQQKWVDEVLSSLGELEDMDLHFGQVLVCKYLRETVGSSGILVASEQTKLEDKYQSKVGIVLKVGPTAFVSEPGRNFGGANAKRGDFVLYRMSDGLDLDIVTLDGLHMRNCKIIHDVEAMAVVKHPDRFW